MAAVLDLVGGDETRWVQGATQFEEKYGKNILEGLKRYKKDKQKK